MLRVSLRLSIEPNVGHYVGLILNVIFSIFE